MDPITTAHYGLTAATRRFESAAVRIANMRGDEDVDLGKEVVEMISAKHQFSANLSVVRFAQDMWKALLDLQAR